MKELEYPFDSQYLLRKRKALKRELLLNDNLLLKKVAILGGSTTHDIKEMLELFLLNYGIKPEFYESEYGKYFEDAVFENKALDEFSPDIIFVHTTNKNITSWPDASFSKEDSDKLLESQYKHFEKVWTRLSKYSCPIIQNNFDYPVFRLLGNSDASSFRGRVNFVNRLNTLFAEYIDSHEGIFLNDLNYQSSCFGLDKWYSESFWDMYKYAMCMDAIPFFAFNIANIIKSIYGKNKKALALDLDNTLWGGVIGDDGVEGICIGKETAVGECYSAFQEYIKELSKQGILLNIVSKNEEENAVAGLSHPEMVLRKEDFVSIKANWDPKSINIQNMAKELNLLPESFVFVDDNPAEREIVKKQLTGVGVPELGEVEDYIKAIDRSGFFEVTAFSSDDLLRNKMYKENIQRAEKLASFEDYGDYLKSLDMKAEIKPFSDVYLQRIAQLTNKSNQFNLTTQRMSEEDIKSIRNDGKHFTLYGKLSDLFGDNGVVSLVIGDIKGEELDITLWLMSCRVLKRDMEFAMMDELMSICKEHGIKLVNGYYYPTAKNAMVKDFYNQFGFKKIEEDDKGNAKWQILVSDYEMKNKYIKVN